MHHVMASGKDHRHLYQTVASNKLSLQCILFYMQIIFVEKALSNLMIAANLKVIMPSYKPISRCQCSIKQFQQCRLSCTIRSH